MSSIRQQIIDYLDTKLKTILVSNGYNSDLGNNVYRWQPNPLPHDTTIALVYKDMEAEVFDAAHNKSDHHLNLTAEIIARAGAASDDEIRKMLNDVIKALGVDFTCSGLAITVKINSHSINDIEPSEKVTGLGTVKFAVLYRTNQFET